MFTASGFQPRLHLQKVPDSVLRYAYLEMLAMESRPFCMTGTFPHKLCTFPSRLQYFSNPKLPDPVSSLEKPAGLRFPGPIIARPVWPQTGKPSPY